MKNFSRYIFLAGALILFIGLAPRFLILDAARKTVTEQLSKKLGSPVTVEKMHWAWLPLPHLSFSRTRFTNEYSEFSAPEMRIYPNWRIIFGKGLMFGSIHLESPEIHINKKAFETERSSEFSLPELNVFMKNGKLAIESDDNYKNILLTDNLLFSNIDGRLKMEQHKAELDLNASSPFSRNIKFKGSFNSNNKNYEFFFDFQDIKLHKSVNAFLKGHMVPIKSSARLAGSITGTGLQNIEGSLHGTLPAFTVRQMDREIHIRPGFADFAFLKSGPLLRLTIKDLQIKEPQINLSGIIERKPSAEENNALEHQETTADPTWTLDLTGSDLDLTAIRKRVMTLWHDNKVAKTVCNIVLGGKAQTAAYRFSGQTADFANLDAMIIEANVREAAIHVPGAELDLTKAKGPVLIEESILTGHNLSAQLGNSFGSNGELLLDLAKGGKAFTLNIDIDADLKALPPVLEQLVNHDGFQRELLKFNEVSGRASGNLDLGDTLDNIVTRVNIGNMQLATRYSPIPQTIFIEKGVLQVGPGEVSWQNVKGRTGLQEIISTNGSVSWQAGDILLDVGKMQGQLDGESLYAMLEQIGVMPDKTKANLSSLNGKIDVSNGSLKGPAREPEAWEYQLALRANGLTVATPLLPAPVIIKKLSTTVSNKAASIQQAEINFFDQSLNLKGMLHHQNLENWYGMLEFNGPVQAGLAGWISSKGWFFEKMRPRIPCTLENLTVNFQGGKTAVKGTLLHGLTGARLPRARIDLEKTQEYLRLNELTFFAPGEQGTMTFDFNRLSPRSLTLSWQGFANADTIDKLFHHSVFTGGIFSGAFFEVSYFADQPAATHFNGILKAENLLLKGSGSSEKKPIIIKNILLNGTGNQLKISALNLDIGTERLLGLGHISAVESGLQLNINLISSFITKKSLNDLEQSLKEFQNFFSDPHPERNDELKIPESWDLTGRIGFDFDSFSMKRSTASFYTGAQPVNYTLYDLHGEFQLAPDTLSRTEIFTSKLCGLDFKSTWYSNEALGQRFELATGSDTALRLESVLPCLGVDQDLIEGEFSLQSNLRKESGKWHSGDIHIKSKEGRILRLSLISRIFMIVNITDLFVTQTGSTGKKGFPFSRLDIDAHINENYLFFDRAILRGEGLNLFLQGDVHLADHDSDMTLLIAPFKSFDTLVSKVPLIGKPLMDEYNSLLAIPVAIKGPLPDPVITPLHPEAVGGALFNVVKGTFKLPYNILKPDNDEESPE